MKRPHEMALLFPICLTYFGSVITFLILSVEGDTYART